MDDEERKLQRPKFGDPKLVVDRSVGRCSHEYVRLLHRNKTVFCRTCGEEVDAFDVLERMAREWDWATYHRRQLEEATNALEAVKREESNVKARLRSAHKLAAPEARATVYYDEYLRRLNEAKDSDAIYAAHRWAADFKWLEPQAYVALADAVRRAEFRAEENRRKNNKRGRSVRVIDGGGQSSPTEQPPNEDK